MLTRRILPVAALLACTGLAAAQVQPEAKQKLQDMVDAYQKAQSLSFSVILKNTGIMSMLPEMKGDVILAKGPGGEQLMHVEGFRGAAPELDKNSKDMNYVLVSDGRNRTWIDHEHKTVFERPAATQGNDEQFSTTNLIIPRELLNHALFSSLLAAPTIKLEEPLTVDGVVCDAIQIKLGEDLEEFRAIVAPSDHLLRRFQRTFAGGGSTSQIWFIKNVKADAPTNPEMWKIKTPEGYTFSPAPVPPPVVAPPAPTANPGAPAAPAVKVRGVGVNPDDFAPDFELKTPDGTTVRLSDLKGTVVLLEFSGTWCPPCKPAAAEVQKLADKYKTAPLKVYTLAVREPSDEAPVEFMKDRKLTFGLLLHADDTAKKYRVMAFPKFFVIGKEGEIAAAVDWAPADTADTVSKITQAIDRCLTGTPPPAPAKPVTPFVKPIPAGGAGADDAPTLKPAPKPRPDNGGKK